MPASFVRLFSIFLQMRPAPSSASSPAPFMKYSAARRYEPVMYRLPPFLRTIFAALLISVLMQGGAAAGSHCLSDREVRRLAASGAVLRPRALRRRINGEILRIRLCYSGRGPVYRLVVMGKGGNVSRVRVDARSGAILSHSGRR
jgi:hypothetical protein